MFDFLITPYRYFAMGLCIPAFHFKLSFCTGRVTGMLVSQTSRLLSQADLFFIVKSTNQ